MADYNKQTVAQLRQILKDRGIPSTGLTRKAQIIEKLEEVDAEGGLGTEQEERHRDGRFSGKCDVMLVWGNIDSFGTILWNRDFSMVFHRNDVFSVL